MRILTLSCEYPPIGGGGGTACRILAEALVRAGHEVDVLTAWMPGLPASTVTEGVRVLRAAGRRKHRHYSTMLEQASFLWPMFWQGRALARQHRYDLIHAHFAVPTGLLAYIIARDRRLPYVITAHGSDVPGYNPERFKAVHQLIGPVSRAVLRNAAAVTSPSRFLSRLIGQNSPVPVDVIPNPLDAAPAFSPTSPQPRRLLVASRLVERKGVHVLLEALDGLDEKVECVIAGDGPQRPALEARAQNLEAEVRFVGFVGREELSSLYASSAIFVLPSAQENFPMVLLEAMRAGCAIVTTTTPGCVEVVGDAGLTVEAGDREALRGAIAHLVGDTAARARLAEAASRRARLFDAEVIAERFVAVFERSLHGSGSSRLALQPTG